MLFLMLFFEVHFFEFKVFQVLLSGGPDLTRETTSPAKDRMVETKNDKRSNVETKPRIYHAFGPQGPGEFMCFYCCGRVGGCVPTIHSRRLKRIT